MKKNDKYSPYYSLHVCPTHHRIFIHFHYISSTPSQPLSLSLSLSLSLCALPWWNQELGWESPSKDQSAESHKVWERRISRFSWIWRRMPLSRYQVRNEYSLADPELYRAADKDDPEALLEGVAMAGLVGVLRQLGDLAEWVFAHNFARFMIVIVLGRALQLKHLCKCSSYDSWIWLFLRLYFVELVLDWKQITPYIMFALLYIYISLIFITFPSYLFIFWDIAIN